MPPPQARGAEKLFASGMKRNCPAAARGCFLFVFAAPLRPHDPITTGLTWTQEISRVVYKRCAGCHHAGGRRCR